MSRRKKLSPKVSVEKPDATRWAAPVALFASGAASLILELVWTRQLALVFGTTEGALSMVLAAYMAGLAMGSYLFGKWCRRWLTPLWLYALLESGIAVSALVLTLGIPHLESLLAGLSSAFAPQTAIRESLRFLTAFAMVAIPTTLMGGTLPVLCAATGFSDDHPVRAVGRLYGANLAGGVVGAFGAGFLLLPSVGITATALLAILFSCLAAGLAAAVAGRSARRQRAVAPSPSSLPESRWLSDVSPSQRKVVLVTLGISGFAALLEEVLWFRSLRLVVGSSTYALTVMLLTFLIGLALGSYWVTLLSTRLRQPLAVLSWMQGAVFLSILLAVYLYPQLPGMFLRSYSLFGSGNGVFFVQAAVSGLVLLPSTVVLGALFPFSARAFATSSVHLGSDVGILYATLTCGNVLGAALATLWLAGFGLSGGLLAAAALHLASSLALAGSARTRSRWLWGFSAAMLAGLLAAPWVRSRWQPLLSTSGVFQNVNYSGDLFTRPEEFFRSLSQFRVLYYKEGRTATVSVYEEPSLEISRHLSLAIDGKADASTGEDMPTQELLGHLPMLIAPQAGDVCVIGWGSGITTGSVLRYPVSHVTAIEIEPAVLEASRFFAEFNHNALADPRLRVVIDDARAVLLRDNRQYQAIISEPSNPWLAGPSKLFTQEFLELGKSRLRPGGVFTQWIHLYGLDESLLKMFLRTFGSVFPHVLAFQATAGDLILLGSDSPLQMDPARIAQSLAQPGIREDLSRIGVTTAADVLRGFRFGEHELADFAGPGPLNTDSLPALEFGAARDLYEDTLEKNQEILLQAFRSIAPYLASGDPESVATSAGLRALLAGETAVARMFAQQFRGAPRTAPAMWLSGELALRDKDFVPAEGWWLRGLTVDTNCYGCAVSAALLLQMQSSFAEADRMLAGIKTVDRADSLASVLHGIDRFYVGDRTGALQQFRLGLDARADSSTDDIRALIEGDIYPLDVLASFYSSEAGEPFGPSSPAYLNTLIASWRVRLLSEPGLTPWNHLLSQIEMHTARAAAAKSEQRLTAQVLQDVLEPLVHFNRGIRAAQMGNLSDTEKEFAEAASRVKDPAGQRRLQQALEKLTGQEPPL
jgi:spermidine synthase